MCILGKVPHSYLRLVSTLDILTISIFSFPPRRPKRWEIAVSRHWKDTHLLRMACVIALFNAAIAHLSPEMDSLPLEYETSSVYVHLHWRTAIHTACDGSTYRLPAGSAHCTDHNCSVRAEIPTCWMKDIRKLCVYAGRSTLSTVPVFRIRGDAALLVQCTWLITKSSSIALTSFWFIHY